MRMQIIILIAIAALFLILALVFQGHDFRSAYGVSRTLLSIAGVVAFIALIFVKVLWKWRGFWPWLTPAPILEGTWKGVLHSTYVNPETGQRVAPKTVYLRVRQTFTEIHADLLTDESSSQLLGGALVPNSNGTYRLVGVYRNEPRQELQAHSAIHHGALMLDIHESSGEAYRLVGSYWTDRQPVQTRGELRFDGWNCRKYSSFAEAESDTYQMREPSDKQLWQFWKQGLQDRGSASA